MVQSAQILNACNRKKNLRAVYGKQCVPLNGLSLCPELSPDENCPLCARYLNGRTNTWR